MKKFIGFAFILAGCSPNQLPDYDLLKGLRVLAMPVDLPEVAPGAQVNITPVVSDIPGAGRTLSWKASGCVDPGVGIGAIPSCELAADQASLGSGTVALSAPSFTQALSSIAVTIPASILDHRLASDQYNGVAYLVTFDISAADGSKVSSFKRVIASNKATKNANPSITDVLSGGSSMAALPQTATPLSLQLNANSIETYTAMTSDQTQVTRVESLTTTWFMSDGSFSRYRSQNGDANTFTPPDTLPTAHAVVLVMVLRDDRGGEDFKIKSYFH